MIRSSLLIGFFVSALAANGAPAWAQDGGRSRGGESSSGSAAPRGGGGDSSGSAVSRPSGSDSGGGGSTSGSVGSSSGGWGAPSASGPSSVEYVAAPVHPSERSERAQRAQGRSRGEGAGERQPRGDGSGGAGRAVPRGYDGGDRVTGTRSTASEGSSAPEPSRRAVPAYSRPRDGRPQTGTAVERDLRGGGSGSGFGLGSYYLPSRYQYYWPGYYGLGLGYLAYDALWFDPLAYGSGYGGVYGLGGGYGGGYGSYGGGAYPGYGSGSYPRDASGSVRLKIKPSDAQVFVDGYFVGVVDSFDGVFQKLAIDAGAHRIEVKAPGHEPVEFEVLVAPDETVTYKGELKRVD